MAQVVFVYWNIFYYGACLFIFVFSTFMVLLMLKCKIDKAAAVMIAFYILSMSIKLIEWSLYFRE